MSENRYPITTGDDILKHVPENFPWLWEGFLRPGALTLFSSPSRIGKSTLMSLLIDRMAKGGTLAGRVVRPGRVFMASEETDAEWGPRVRTLNLKGHTKWSMCPFPVPPSSDRWIDYVINTAVPVPADLYIFDSLQHFLPAHAENSVYGIGRSFSILKLLLQKGASVWMLHHPNKGADGDFSIRGSVALEAGVHITMELKRPTGSAEWDRRRILQVRSKYDPKPRVRLELNADGTDYTVLTEKLLDEELEASWEGLKITLEDATERLSCEGILREWPPDYKRPSDTTLRDLLNRTVADGRTEQFGLGRKARPFRYALPGRTFDPSKLPPRDPDVIDRDRFG